MSGGGAPLAVSDGEAKWARHPDVYSPREDSELLAEAVSDHPWVGRACEVGSGSGYVTVALSRISDIVLAIDISMDAARLTRENLIRFGSDNCAVVCGDLLTAVGTKFDLICFNPPYLPEEPGEDPLSRSWAGGSTGREVIARFLSALPDQLTENGEAFVVTSSLMGFDELGAIIRETGLEHDIVSIQRLDFEELAIWRLRRPGIH